MMFLWGSLCGFLVGGALALVGAAWVGSIGGPYDR